MDIYTKDGQLIMCLPDNAICKAAGKSPQDIDKCPLGFDKPGCGQMPTGRVKL